MVMASIVSCISDSVIHIRTIPLTTITILSMQEITIDESPRVKRMYTVQQTAMSEHISKYIMIMI